MNVSWSYFTPGTALPWTPEAAGVLASFRMMLHQAERLEPFPGHLVSITKPRQPIRSSWKRIRFSFRKAAGFSGDLKTKPLAMAS